MKFFKHILFETAFAIFSQPEVTTVLCITA